MQEQESDDYVNQQVQPIVLDLYRLRKIEYDHKSDRKKYQQAKPIIEKILHRLTKDRDFLLHRLLWEELHDRMGYYYDYLNKTNLNQKIPLFRVTLHNRFAVWYYKYQDQTNKTNKKLASTILHFDSHDDMGLPSNGGGLIKNKLIDLNGMKMGECGQINHPVTCLILSQEIERVFWLIPEWIYDDDYTTTQYLGYHHKSDQFSYFRPQTKTNQTKTNQTKIKTDQYRLKKEVKLISQEQIDQRQKDPDWQINQFELNRVHTEKLAGWKKLKRSLKPNEKFILDIDLDYFVTNGDKITKSEYQQNFEDVQSTHRTHGQPGDTTPRQSFVSDQAEQFKSKLRKEFREINQRIDLFLEGLAMLKKNGNTPTMIGVSGSTPSFFSGQVENAVFTNNYTPKYFVPYIQHKVITNLKRLYKTSFV